MKILFLIVVRTTRADPRHHRKHVHHRHQSSQQQHFDDADERSHKDNSNSSPLINGDTKTTSQVKIFDILKKNEFNFIYFSKHL